MNMLNHMTGKGDIKNAALERQMLSVSNHIVCNEILSLTLESFRACFSRKKSTFKRATRLGSTKSSFYAVWLGNFRKLC